MTKGFVRVTHRFLGDMSEIWHFGDRKMVRVIHDRSRHLGTLRRRDSWRVGWSTTAEMPVGQARLFADAMRAAVLFAAMKGKTDGLPVVIIERGQ